MSTEYLMRRAKQCCPALGTYVSTDGTLTAPYQSEDLGQHEP
jgi:hypothetical protein